MSRMTPINQSNIIPLPPISGSRILLTLKTPLVRQEDEKIYIEDFREARRLILPKKGHGCGPTFFDDDGAAYRRHLESFNIFQDEWKSIVLKINESEGGVIEIFEKCKNSLQLMNDWILKSVEKVVPNDESDQQKLEQMFENLVRKSSTMSNLYMRKICTRISCGNQMTF